MIPRWHGQYVLGIVGASLVGASLIVLRALASALALQSNVS